MAYVRMNVFTDVAIDGRMLTMTPVDPLFLLYAILKASGQVFFPLYFI